MARKTPALTDLASFAAAPPGPVDPVLARRPPGRPRGARLELLGGRVSPALAAAWRSCCTISNREQQAELAAAIERHLRVLVAGMPKDARAVAHRRAEGELESILTHLSQRAPLTPDERPAAAADLARLFEERKP